MSAVELDGAYNVRELGGLATLSGGQTRPGMLFRGDSLDCISERDEDVLFNKLNIGAVIDIRSQQEIANAKWKESAARYYQIPLLNDGDIGKQAYADATPGTLALACLSSIQQGASAVRATFEILADHLSARIPCIVNCAAGRDRTGVIIAILLDSLGVRDEDIALDYVQSNRHAHRLARRLAENPLYANGQPAAGKPAMANADTILGFLKLLRQAYGTPARFLLDSGLAVTALMQLRIALVDSPRL